MLESAALVPGAHAVGPLAVLSALILSAASTRIWSRNVGETSCGWRTDYSPDGRAFGIWGLLYLGTVATALLQLSSLVFVVDWWANFYFALTWVFCAAWVPLFDAESPGFLVLAATQIARAAAGGRWGAWLADAGRDRGTRVTAVALSWPLSLLAGWLLTATSIGVGIAAKANAHDAQKACILVPPQERDETERSYRQRRRVLYREAYARAPAVESPVPIVLSAALAGLAVLIGDPLLPLPLVWAIVNLKAFPAVSYVLSIVLCGCGVAGALVRSCVRF